MLCLSLLMLSCSNDEDGSTAPDGSEEGGPLKCKQTLDAILDIPFSGGMKNLCDGRAAIPRGDYVLAEDRFGRNESAYEPKGTDGIIATIAPSLRSEQDWTIGLWVFLEPGTNKVFESTGTESGLKVWVNDYRSTSENGKGTVVIRVADATQSLGSPGIEYVFPFQDWVFLCIVRSGENFKTFIGPDLAGSARLPMLPTMGLSELRLGYGYTELEPGQGYITSGFKGRLDDIVVWARALTPEEIRTHYEREKVEP